MTYCILRTCRSVYAGTSDSGITRVGLIFTLTCLLLLIGSAGWGTLGGTVHAAQSVRVGNILIHYGAVGEDPLAEAINNKVLSQQKTDDFIATRVFSATEKQQIEQAASYFAALFPHASPDATANIFIGYAQSLDPAASAFSYSPGVELINGGKPSPNGSVFDAFITSRPAKYPSYLADNIIIFQTDYDSAPTRLLLKDASVMSTILHELGHAFGIMTGFTVDPDNNTKGAFSKDYFTAWDSHLYDVFGKQAKPDMSISMDVIKGSASREGVFQIYAQSTDPDTITDYTYATFKGDNVNALTDGKGMPVMGGFGNEGNFLNGANSLGHPGIMQSIMSYGIIRNMPFTEMELAVFQDLGYSIDRSQFFGKSYYYDVGGSIQVNTRGFGTAAAPNTTLFGLGTHIMRDGLTLTQQADIYANGVAGGGVRIDGVGNKLTIPTGVTVAADGGMGTGLLVSYGSGNSIVLDGTLRANGAGGIGAHFGVLAPAPGIGSYMEALTTDNEGNDLPTQQVHEYYLAAQQMDGPLVTDFSISGTLSGKEAAISIERDVHVETINLLSGAHIEGHIISDWDREGWTSNGTLVGGGTDTALNIGSATTPTGHMYLTGNIVGLEGAKNSININQKGGTLHFNGLANVYQWGIQSDATLTGNSTITIDGTDQAQVFTNAGTISPGNSIGRIVINGNYTQTPTGGLRMEFNATQADAFVINGTVTGTGDKMTLTALPDFYASGVSRVLTDQELFEGSLSQTTHFSNDVVLDTFTSPTLQASFSSSGGAAVFSVQRVSDAYSRYGANHSDSNVGRALGGIVNEAQGDMRNLFTVLDFSAADGSGIRSGLNQLSPMPYGYSAQASAEANLMLGRMALEQLRILTASTPPAPAAQDGQRGLASGSQVQSQWNAFVAPFASTSSQQGYNGMPGYNAWQAGLMGGVYTQHDALSLGVYTAFAHRQMDVNTSAKSEAKATTLHLGGMTMWKPDPTGWHLFAQAQIGIENIDTRRAVQIGNYARQNESFVTAFSGTALAGGGWQWQVDSLTFGPYAGLEYALNVLPKTEEWGGQATRLSIEPFSRHDLRGVVGVNLEWSSALGEAQDGRKIKASLDAAWRQDLLNSEYTMRSSFVGYGNHGFDTSIKRQGHGGLGIMSSLQMDVREDVSLGVHVQAEVLRQGYNSLGGGLSLRWEF